MAKGNNQFLARVCTSIGNQSGNFKVWGGKKLQLIYIARDLGKLFYRIIVVAAFYLR